LIVFSWFAAIADALMVSGNRMRGTAGEARKTVVALSFVIPTLSGRSGCP